MPAVADPERLVPAAVAGDRAALEALLRALAVKQAEIQPPTGQVQTSMQHMKRASSRSLLR